MSRVSVHQLYMPSNGLMECLKMVGVTSGPLFLQQIMDRLKDYIMEKRLFDPTCPTRIICGQDPLGKVLGVERFLVSEVIGLLVKQIRAVPTQHVVSQGALKREPQSGGACEGGVEVKRPRLEPDSTTSGAGTVHTSPITIFIPQSPSYDSGAETEYSVQGRETDFVKDTSDDLWFLDESSGGGYSSSDSEATQQRILRAATLAAELLRQQRLGRVNYSDQDSDCPFEVEYEIEEDSDGNRGGRATSISSDSDIEEVAQAEILICVNDDDAQFWADSSDSYSSDSEIGDADLWQCRLCGLRCEPHGLSAVQRYCTGCWKDRFGWLPDRTERHPPQKKRRRAQRRTSRQMSRVRADRNGSLTLESRHQLDSAGEENRPASCTDKNEASHSGSSNTESNSGGSQESFSDPSVSEMLPPHSNSSQATSSQELADGWSQPGCSTGRQGGESTSSSGGASDLCTICLVRPKCGILVHGRTSHRLSCYKCALQLQKRNQPCPVCRRRIQRVVRNFDA